MKIHPVTNEIPSTFLLFVDNFAVLCAPPLLLLWGIAARTSLQPRITKDDEGNYDRGRLVSQLL